MPTILRIALMHCPIYIHMTWWWVIHCPRRPLWFKQYIQSQLSLNRKKHSRSGLALAWYSNRKYTVTCGCRMIWYQNLKIRWISADPAPGLNEGEKRSALKIDMYTMRNLCDLASGISILSLIFLVHIHLWYRITIFYAFSFAFDTGIQYISKTSGWLFACNMVNTSRIIDRIGSADLTLVFIANSGKWNSLDL